MPRFGPGVMPAIGTVLSGDRFRLTCCCCWRYCLANVLGTSMSRTLFAITVSVGMMRWLNEARGVTGPSPGERFPAGLDKERSSSNVLKSGSPIDFLVLPSSSLMPEMADMMLLKLVDI